MERQNFDYIIAGGGIAGLSLLHYLLNSSLKDRKIALVDSGVQTAEKTIGFWTKKTTAWTGLAEASWSAVRVLSDNANLASRITLYKYYALSANRYRQYVMAEAEEHKSVTFIQRKVEGFSENSEGVCVQVDGKELHAQWLFDSTFRSGDFQPRVKEINLKQYFAAWEVETERAEFDPKEMTMFDFRIEQKGELRFFYILPMSETRAIIYYVGLNPQPYQELLKEYVENTLGVKNYKVIRHEGGVSPLTTYRFPRKLGEHTLAIGAKGGMVKPSSGYAFSRIQADSRAIVRSLVKYGHPFALPREPLAIRLADKVMLNIWQMGKGKEVFEALFMKNPVALILQFLDQEASLWGWLRLGWSFPKVTFMRALVKTFA